MAYVSYNKKMTRDEIKAATGLAQGKIFFAKNGGIFLSNTAGTADQKAISGDDPILDKKIEVEPVTTIPQVPPFTYVEYETQSPTEAQKAQARENLGAQASTDSTLSTTDKNIVGAINEVNTLANSKYTKPSGGIPISDLDTSNQTLFTGRNSFEDANAIANYDCGAWSTTKGVHVPYESEGYSYGVLLHLGAGYFIYQLYFPNYHNEIWIRKKIKYDEWSTEGSYGWTKLV